MEMNSIPLMPELKTPHMDDGDPAEPIKLSTWVLCSWILGNKSLGTRCRQHLALLRVYGRPDRALKSCTL